MQLNRVAAAQRPAYFQRGFTLIELMITLTLLGILLALAAPSFGTWINNTRVRTVANTLQDGVRLAQAEATRRNRVVIFFLTNDEPSASASSIADGKNWGIQSAALFTGDPTEFVRGGALSDVARDVTITGPRALCFNASGQQVTISAQNCAVTAARFAIERSGADRSLRVDVSIGGRVRMCDPAKTLSPDHPDGCEA